MTWKEFKKAVEDAGVTNDTKILFLEGGDSPRLEDLEINCVTDGIIICDLRKH